jgi:two-component system sensor histidine kinase DesK
MVWLGYLSEPLTASLDAPNAVLRVLGVAGTVGVAVLFAASTFSFRLRSVPTRTAWAVLAVQTLFVVLASLAGAQSGLVTSTFVGVTAVFLLRSPAALVVAAVFAVLAYALPRLIPGWVPEDSTAMSVVLSAFAVFGFTQLITRNRQLFRAQEEVVSLAAAQERERLARDVHDVVGHSLTVVSVKAELAARLVRADPDRAADELADIQRLARSALADVRGMVTGARTVTLAGELAAARSAYDAAGIEVQLPSAVDVVPSDRQELFAWALREATTNVLRHAAASRVVVTLDERELTVDDDGRGAGATTPAGGNGLRGLAERARTAGATLITGPGSLGGFRVAVRFPA